MDLKPGRISVCIPHWQVQDYMAVCLRSIRKHSEKYDLEVLVVDNGSKDASLDYLRSLDWIRLIERPEEVHTNWPNNTLTAWDLGARNATGEFFATVHSDVFIKRDGWLDEMLACFERDPKCAAAGAWKLELESQVYQWQKRVFGYLNAKVKSIFGRKREILWKQGHFPRDYCAMYRTRPIVENDLTFQRIHGQGGGYSITKQMWDLGHTHGMISVREMADNIFHVAHGTAAVRSEKTLNHKRAQKKVERKVHELFEEPWIQDLLHDKSLDEPMKRAA